MRAIKNRNVRKFLKITIPYVGIPAVLAAGVFVFDEKRYAYCAVVIVLLALLLFTAGFERRETGSRRLVLVSILTALAVAGRFIPFFKPVTAIIMIAGIYLGGEAGFLTGVLTAVISNFYFGQGPWTLFQMFAWGMIGLLAGLSSSALQKNKPLLLIYGAGAGVLYSLMLDVWTVLWYQNGFQWSLYLAAIKTAIPYTLLYAASNVVFLLLLNKPFGEKLSRIKLKYGV